MIEAEAKQDEQDREPFEVYEQNWLAVLGFMTLQTQWVTEVAGETVIYKGFNYAAFPVVLVMIGAKPEDAQDMFLGLRIMEGAALTVLNEKDEDVG